MPKPNRGRKRDDGQRSDDLKPAHKTWGPAIDALRMSSDGHDPERIVRFVLGPRGTEPSAQASQRAVCGIIEISRMLLELYADLAGQTPRQVLDSIERLAQDCHRLDPG